MIEFMPSRIDWFQLFDGVAFPPSQVNENALWEYITIFDAFRLPIETKVNPTNHIASSLKLNYLPSTVAGSAQKQRLL
jgi:hypothetical protein